MALKTEFINIRLDRGIDTEKDPHTLVPGTPTEVMNGTYTAGPRIQKRPGTDRLERTTVGNVWGKMSGNFGLASRDDENDLVALDNSDRLFSRVGDRWFHVGNWVHQFTDVTDLPKRPHESWDATTASTGSTRIVAWEDARGGIYAHLWDDDRSVALTSEFRIGASSGRCARAIEIDGHFHVYYVDGTTLKVGTVPAADPTSVTVSLRTVASDFVGLSNFLAAGGTPLVSPYDVGRLGAYVAVAWANSGTISLGYVNANGFIDAAGAVPHVVLGDNAASGPSLAISPNQSRLAVSYMLAGYVNPVMVSLDPFLNELGDQTLDNHLHGNGTVSAIVSAFDPQTSLVNVVFEVSGNNTNPALGALEANRWLSKSVAATGGSVALSSGSYLRHSKVATKPFALSGTLAMWAIHDTATEPTDFIIRLSDMSPFGRSRNGNCVPNASGTHQMVDVRGNVATYAATNREIVPLPGTAGSTFADRDVKLVTTEYHPLASWRPYDVDGLLFMPGGWLGTYDGAQVVEHGFALDSVIESVGQSSASLVDGGIPPGQASIPASYLWAAIPEWTDARGNRTQGYYVAKQSTFTTANNVATLTVRTLAHTLKTGAVGFGIYRTSANGLITTLQRVGFVANDPSLDYVTYLDAANETVRGAGESAYTNGENPNQMPPGCRFITSAGDRLVLAGLEGAPYDLQPSKLRLGGPVHFDTAQGTSVDSAGGPITALDTVSDLVNVFKRGKVFIWNPTGPGNSSNDGSVWQVPTNRTSDVGAPAPGTTLQVAGQTEQGIMFKSLRGFRLVDTSETVKNVGYPAKAYDDLTVVGGVAPRLTEEARFYTSEGTIVVFNTRFDTWSTYQGRPASAACSWQGKPTYASPDGYVYVEDTGSFTDGDDFYPLSITLGWLNFGELQGVGRLYGIYLDMDYKSPHSLRFEMRTDDQDGWTLIEEVPTTDSLPGIDPFGGPPGFGTGSFGGGDNRYQLSFRNLPDQRMEQFQFRISDTAQSGSGESFTIREIKAEVGRESRKPRLNATKRY